MCQREGLGLCEALLILTLQNKRLLVFCVTPCIVLHTKVINFRSRVNYLAIFPPQGNYIYFYPEDLLSTMRTLTSSPGMEKKTVKIGELLCMK